MDRSPFIREAHGPYDSISSNQTENTMIGHDNYVAQSSSSLNPLPTLPDTHSPEIDGMPPTLPPKRNLYPPVMQAGSRFRGGQKEVDINTWDEEASAHLLSMRRTPGDLCDCLRPCRRPFKLRYPPSSQKMTENCLQGYPLPTGVVWFVRDVAGFICMLFTWLLIAYAEFVVSCIILPQLPNVPFAWIFGIVYHIFAFLAVCSHCKAVFTDPVRYSIHLCII